MEKTQNDAQSGDLARLMREAEQAEAEAGAAVQRATKERAEAESAQRRALEEAAARRTQWAQSVADSYDADLAAAEAAMRDSSDRFAELAVRDLPEALGAYLAWSEASVRHYALQVRAATVAPELGFEATPAQPLSPPPFSEALDAAIQLHGAAMSARIRDEMAEEIEQRPARGSSQTSKA